MPFPNLPWTDGQLYPPAGFIAGIQYIYVIAENRWKINAVDVVGIDGLNSTLPEKFVRPDKMDFSASFGVQTPPGIPMVGQSIVVGSNPNGAFAGLADHLQIWNGTTWTDVPPYEGLILWDQDANVLKAWNGTAWDVAVTAGAGSVASSVSTTAIQDGAVTSRKTNFNIVTRQASVAPSGASIGDSYIVAATPFAGDAWFGQTGKIASKIGTTNTAADWSFIAPRTGQLFWIQDETALLAYNVSSLVSVTNSGVIPATRLDLTSLTAVQAEQIVSTIDNDASGALATLTAALGISGGTTGTAHAKSVAGFAYITSSAASAAITTPMLTYLITTAFNGQGYGSETANIGSVYGSKYSVISTKLTMSNFVFNTGTLIGSFDITFNPALPSGTYFVTEIDSQVPGSTVPVISNRTTAGFHVAWGSPASGNIPTTLTVIQ